MKKSVLPVMSIVVLILLLSHPSLSLEGARNGLLLWYQTVVPTLLPFMICSNVIVSLNGIRLMIAPVRPLLNKVFGLSDPGCYVLITGLLCGYPMGAKTCSEFVEQGMLSPGEGKYLLSVSNHPSPMFLLGFTAVRALVLGAVEITTGIQAVARAFLGPAQGLFLCAGAVFGGLCGLFQTKSVLRPPLSLTHYALWKLLHAGLSAAVFSLLASSLLP